jgi:hypothetical protein
VPLQVEVNVACMGSEPVIMERGAREGLQPVENLKGRLYSTLLESGVIDNLKVSGTLTGSELKLAGRMATLNTTDCAELVISICVSQGHVAIMA